MPAGRDDERTQRRDYWRARGASWNQRDAAADRMRDDRLNGALIVAAGIGTGGHVLDLGAGGGEPSIGLAVTVGARGLVVALDHAPEMLDGTRRRAAGEALAQISCVVADMVELPFADAAFDAVVGRFSLMSVPDHNAALREARRVLRPGGRAGFMVWGPEEHNDRFRGLAQGARAFFGDEGAASPARHALGTPGAMAALLREAGFTAIEERAIDDMVEIPADRPVWARSVARRYGNRLASMTLDDRAAFDDALRQAFAPFRDGDVYRLRAQACLAAGTAPVER